MRNEQTTHLGQFRVCEQNLKTQTWLREALACSVIIVELCLCVQYRVQSRCYQKSRTPEELPVNLPCVFICDKPAEQNMISSTLDMISSIIWLNTWETLTRAAGVWPQCFRERELRTSVCTDTAGGCSEYSAHHETQQQTPLPRPRDPASVKDHTNSSDYHHSALLKKTRTDINTEAL